MPVDNSTSRNELWSQQLRTLSAQSLTHSPDFPAIAERWEAWWSFASDRPLLVAAVPKHQGIRWDKGFDLLGRSQAWLALRKQQMQYTHWVDATVPSIRVDIGPVATAACLGVPLQFAPEEQTVWHTPILDHLLPQDPPVLGRANHWLEVVLSLAESTATDAAGSYLVSLPDLSGPSDVLARLRGTERLLMDMYDAPDAVVHATGFMVSVWQEIFSLLYNTILGSGAGVTTWLHAWSNTPYTVPTCDLSAMIGPQHFSRMCLPSLLAQARRAGRCLFHLDGPRAAIHAEALAAETAITAVQYTPGAGTPSALAKLEMLRMLQAAGKPVMVFCPKEEVPILIDRLDHRGLALAPENLARPEEADALLELVTTW